MFFNNNGINVNIPNFCPPVYYQDAGDLSSLTTAINYISKVADQRKLS